MAGLAFCYSYWSEIIVIIRSVNYSVSQRCSHVHMKKNALFLEYITMMYFRTVLSDKEDLNAR